MRLEHLTFGYEEHPVIRDLTGEVPEKGITAIRGASGLGKSTLLKLMGGLLRPEAGSIRTGDGPTEHEKDPHALMTETSFLFQEDRLLPGLNAQQQIRVVLGKKADPELPLRALSWVGLEGQAKEPVGNLSGGMKRRLSLARALAYAVAEGKSRLILDEPFAGVDEAGAARIMSQIKALDIPVIMAAHEAATLGMADRVIDLNAWLDGTESPAHTIL